MKKIEDLFKSALRDQELPYDESAWNEMSKKCITAKNIEKHISSILFYYIIIIFEKIVKTK